MLKLVNYNGKVYAVCRVEIRTHGLVEYTAFEPAKPAGSHSTLRSADAAGEPETHAVSVWWGEVKTRRLPPDIDAIRGPSPERSAALRAFWEELHRVSYAVIEAAYGAEVTNGERREGEITVREAA